MKISRRHFALGLAAISASGCARPWKIVAMADGRPFVNARRFLVVPVDYAGVLVAGRPVEAWLDDQNDDEKRRFAAGQRDLSAAFAESLAEEAKDFGAKVWTMRGKNDGIFCIVAPRVTAIEPGLFRSPEDKLPSAVAMRVRIIAPNNTHDDISLESTSQASLILHGSDDCLRHDGHRLGEAVAEYLKERSA